MDKRKRKKPWRRDRNFVIGPMTQMEKVANPDGAEDLGIVATFENNRYGAFVKVTQTDGFGVPGHDGKTQTLEVAHLIMMRLDRKKIEIPWEEKQEIKNQLFGPASEGVEVFPSDMRRMTSIADHQSHMWVFPPGYTIPVGMIPRAMQEMARKSRLDSFSVLPEDLEVFVVDDEIAQVFASKEDAAASYSSAGNDMPDGGVEKIGSAPSEGDGAAWSEEAKKKIAIVLGKAMELDNLSGDGSLSMQETRVNTNGPETDQDELEAEYGVGDFAPNGDEESVMGPEYMAMGMDQMKKDRKDLMAKSVVMLEEWIAGDAQRQKDAEVQEEVAKDDLAEMRRKMREGQKSEE